MGSSPPLKPRALAPGDTVGVIAPASDIRPDMLAEGRRELESLGFRTVAREDIDRRHRFFAGSLERRTDELNQMLRDDGVRAIFCARGGYGSGRLLAGLDLEEIRRHPKIICGASDITMLLAAWQRAGVVAFHGPMVATTLRAGRDAYDRDLLLRILVEGEAPEFPMAGCEVLRAGEAEGRLTGGCLSLVTATVGTPWEIDARDAVLVLEDIDCRPYQIDRMLTHLRHAGMLEAARGLVFGQMPGCRQHPDQDYTLQEVILDALEGLDRPVLFGLPTGHASRSNAIVPFGVRARLSLGPEPVFELLEPAVTPARPE